MIESFSDVDLSLRYGLARSYVTDGDHSSFRQKSNHEKCSVRLSPRSKLQSRPRCRDEKGFAEQSSALSPCYVSTSISCSICRTRQL